MSLTLLQGYSSAEEEQDDENFDTNTADQISSDDELNDAVPNTPRSYNPLFDPNPPRSYKPLFDPNQLFSSSLPSAFDAFSEIAGPPQFLNNSVKEEVVKEEDVQGRRGGKRHRKDKKDLPSGAVVQSKPHLVGIHERVRSDVEGKASQGQSTGPGVVSQGSKRVSTVSNPNAEDAAELLRMCVRCGIPKTYSHNKGIVCPLCGDKPAADSDKEALKKKGSAVKDKEKSKRMKGQSSHATWKSETEMQLRQQFD